MSSPRPVPSLYPTLRQALGPDQVLLLSKVTLVDMSHAIEEMVLEERLPAAVFTGFQESSHWAQEVERYRALAQVARRVCIFARGDLTIAEHVSCEGVTLAIDDALSQEWFLLVLTQEFSVVLCGQDCHQPHQTEADRLFETLWTFEPEQVARCQRVIQTAVDHYRPELSTRIAQDFQDFPPVNPNPRHVTQFVRWLARSQEKGNARLREANALLEARVKARTRELQTALEAREALFQQLQDLTYTITHDVRTPLIATDLVLRRAMDGFYGEPTPALKNLMADIRRSDRQLIALTENLLRLARLDAQVEEIELTAVPLVSLLEQVTRDLSALALEKNIVCELTLIPLTVWGSESELRRVFMNLLDNAIKFSPPHGTISINLTVAQEQAMIAVQDQGPGMDLEEREQLFERFWQGKKRQLGRGTGLGLYLSSRLIAAQAGTLTVQSELGQGSTFTVMLPLAPDLT